METDDWEVDKKGYITKCKEQQKNPTKDRIRKKGTTGWNKENSLSGLSIGTITKQEPIEIGCESGSIMLPEGTLEDRINLFKFCADNSDVEFSLMEFDLDNGEIHNSMLTTSHDERSFKKDRIGDNVGSLIAKKYAEVLQLHIHNHFGTGEYGWSASTYDYDFKELILGIQQNNAANRNDNIYPSAKFGIYKCRGHDRSIFYY